MSDWTLSKLSFRAGVWTGRLSAPARVGPVPTFEALADGRGVPGAEFRADGPDAWTVVVPVPPDALGDGSVAFQIADRADGTTIARFAIAAGEPADDDLRAEVTLLRAELDMLKKAVRRLAASAG